LPFPKPYFEFTFEFNEATGGTDLVQGFGIRDKDRNNRAAYELRNQIEVLFGGDFGPRDGSFALDLCKTSGPNQLIIARLARKETFAETISELQRRIDAHPKGHLQNRFGPNDELRVPTMHWRIDHRFQEIEGIDRKFLNPSLRDLYLSKAFQSIYFRLDRAGADLKSEAGPTAGAGTHHYYFDQPYLIVIRKRGAANPFFVMWVDNAELMVK
jgi:hypothetical protein